MDIHYLTAPKCHDCGRFYRWEDGDEYTDFGSMQDLGLPDPTLLCAKCSKAREDAAVDQIKRPAKPYIPWRLGRCHRNVVKRLGMVLAGPPKASWCKAWWPDDVPDGWTLHELD
jgi:hypothetical protein